MKKIVSRSSSLVPSSCVALYLVPMSAQTIREQPLFARDAASNEAIENFIEGLNLSDEQRE